MKRIFAILRVRWVDDGVREEPMGHVVFEDGQVVLDTANLAEMFMTPRWNSLEDAMNHYADWSNGYVRTVEVTDLDDELGF